MGEDPLSHFDPGGAARMVAIAEKAPTARSAVAEAFVRMQPATRERIEAGRIGKGDVLGVSRIAGIGGAKATAGLIPLCHPVCLTQAEISFEVQPDGVRIVAAVHAVDRTGPEMEALTAVTTAALALYDMCKAMDRGMTIERVRLLEKRGGKSGHWRAPPG
jgi:cyclic pyranopterin monophosphate synthase